MTPFKLEWLELWDKVLGRLNLPGGGARELLVLVEEASVPLVLGMVLGVMVVPDLVFIPPAAAEENLDRPGLGAPVGPGKLRDPPVMVDKE
jgi:hypothetical protein